MKKIACLTFLIVTSILFFHSKIGFAQNDCPRIWGVACFASEIGHAARISPPANFERRERGLTINVSYNFFTPQAQAAFGYAMKIWESILTGTQPLKINAYLFPAAGSGVLGITFPNARKNFPGAPLQDVWYPTSLANQLAGTELNIGENDVDIYLNSAVNWYFGTDGNCPVGKYDFVSVVLHELGHGLGFLGLSKVENGLGSFGLLQEVDFSPATTSFPWPQLDTLPSVFDIYLVNKDTLKLSSITNPSDTLANEFVSNDIFWNGIEGVTYSNNQMPRIYAPSAWELGSSMIHLDEQTYPAGNPNEMMTPYAAPHSSNHNPGPVALAMLKDIGWNVDPSYNSVTDNDFSSLHTFPNPVSDKLYVSNKSSPSSTIDLIDLTGRIIYSKSEKEKSGGVTVINMKSTSPGIYFLRITDEKGNLRVKKIVKQ